MRINRLEINLTDPLSTDAVHDYVNSGARNMILVSQIHPETGAYLVNEYQKPSNLLITKEEITSFVLLEFAATLQTDGMSMDSYMVRSFFDELLRNWLHANLENLLQVLGKDLITKEVLTTTLLSQKRGILVA